MFHGWMPWRLAYAICLCRKRRLMFFRDSKMTNTQTPVVSLIFYAKSQVANSQLAIEKGEIDQALNMLRTMKPDHPQFPMAKAAMADIYLKHRKDKKAYARRV